MRRLVAMPVLAVSALLAACGGDGDGGGGGRPQVVASLAPLAEVAEAVGGDAVDVTDLTPPGTEPHDVELTSDQVDDVLDADLAVILGGGFQPAVEEAADRRDRSTVVVLDELDLPAGADEDDPHVWLDPTLLRQAVDAVEAALTEVVPDDGAALAAAADRFRTELAELDAGFAAGLGACQRDLVVTAHDAFGHLARRYGLRTEAITGLAPEAEADPARLGELADLVAREGVTTVFTEPLVAPDVAEALAREVGVTTAVLDTIESRPDGGYLAAMRRNRDALAEGLGCR